MESFPLNKAHQLERCVESLLKHKKFDECIECHKNAIKYLQTSLQATANTKAKESIQLQINHHCKQMDSLQIKRSQYQDQQQLQNTATYSKLANYVHICGDNAGELLQNEIFKTMETHDSLIEYLFKKNSGSDVADSDRTDSGVGGNVPDDLKVSGKIRRNVDDAVLLEEFKVLSEKLREFIHILVLQLEQKDAEITRLRSEVIRMGQNDQNNPLNKDRNEMLKDQQTLKVVDSSGGTSPFVFSPSSELSPDMQIREDIPSLDLTSLNKKSDDLNSSPVKIETNKSE